MAVPTSIADLATTAADNSPSGGESPSAIDNYLRALSAIIKQNSSKGSDIASSTTISIPNDGSYFVVTGTNHRSWRIFPRSKHLCRALCICLPY